MNIKLPQKEFEALKRFQRNVSGSDYIKVTGILMLHNGNSVQNISDSLGIDIPTVYRYSFLSNQRTFQKSSQ
jgi:transposase-like protein